MLHLKKASFGEEKKTQQNPKQRRVPFAPVTHSIKSEI